MKNSAPQNIRRILIRAANWVGDAVMSIPMIRAVRKNFPYAEITVLAKPWVAAVFENSPDIDRIYIYEAGGRHGGTGGILTLCRELRRERFDLAVLVQNAFEAALIAFLSGVPQRMGYDTDGRTLLLTHAVPMTREIKMRHQIDYYLGVLTGAGLHPADRRLRLEIRPEERRRTGRKLKDLVADTGVSAAGGIIGINPGAAFGSAKRWPADRFADLSRRLRHLRPDLPVAVFGGPGEESLGREICEAVGEGCVNLCGRTSLREAICLIERCRLFVTNDSGLMHVAAALDVPQAAIFGPTDNTTTSPASRKARMVRVPTPCAPCMKPECPLGHHRCMKAVTVAHVLKAVLPLLGNGEDR